MQEQGDDDRKKKWREFAKIFNRVRDPLAVDENGIATVEVVGPLMTGAVEIDKLNGATDYQDISNDILDAIGRDDIKAVVLSVDSGGGMALGAPEVASLIAELAQDKPVVAWTGSIMASAAYYVSAGATAVTASPSAIVGSIGTVAQIMDITGMLERAGVKVHTITPDQSDLKTTNYPTVELSDAQRDRAKEQVTEINEEFMTFVQTYRDGVEKDSMRGQTFSGRKAASKGLVDAIGSFADAKALALRLTQG